MLYGIAPVLEALRARRRSLQGVLIKEGSLSPRLAEVAALAASRGLRVRQVRSAELESKAQSPQHQGVVLQCGELPTLDLATWLGERGGAPGLLVALDRVEDPQNLGGIVRSAAYLGAHGAFLHRGKRSPLSASASKASAGTLEFFPILEVHNLAQGLEQLREANWFVYGSELDATAEDYRSQTPAARTVLVVGNEGEGLRALTKRKCDVLVRIPGSSATDSLNVNVATGILLAHFRART